MGLIFIDFSFAYRNSAQGVSKSRGAGASPVPPTFPGVNKPGLGATLQVSIQRWQAGLALVSVLSSCGACVQEDLGAVSGATWGAGGRWAVADV